MSNEAVIEFSDVNETAKKIDVAASMVRAKKMFKKGYLAQFFDIRRLHRKYGRISAGEYYLFQLFAKDRRAQEEFLGAEARKEIYRKANDPKWIPIENDKLETSKLLSGHELPVPRDYGLFHPSMLVDGIPTLKSKDELAAFLRDGIAYPFFAKPLTGESGVGVLAVQRYDKSGDRLVIANNRAAPVERFIDGIAQYYEKGYLFQELLEPHAELVRVGVRRLSSVRAMLIYEEGRDPEIYCTVWKIPAGENFADNVWHEGNFLAAVDSASGEVSRVVSGWGADEREIEDHPESGARLKGMTLPDWQRLREHCDTAARLFPGLRLQAWDVALTSRGPVILEINGGGGFTIPQRASGKGLMSGRLRELIESWS